MMEMEMEGRHTVTEWGGWDQAPGSGPRKVFRSMALVEMEI